MPFASIGAIVGGAQLISGFLQGDASRDASQAQVQASDRAARFQENVFSDLKGFAKPYQQAGETALADLSAGTAKGGQFSHVFDQNDFYNNAPGYQFRLGQGQMAASNSLNKMGGIGGNFAKGLQDYTQGFASNEWERALNQYQGQQQNIFNRLSNIAGMGQQANASLSGAAAPISQGVSNAMIRSGDASAAGTMGQANAFGNAINNAGSWYAMSRM